MNKRKWLSIKANEHNSALSPPIVLCLSAIVLQGHDNVRRPAGVLLLQKRGVSWTVQYLRRVWLQNEDLLYHVHTFTKYCLKNKDMYIKS